MQLQSLPGDDLVRAGNNPSIGRFKLIIISLALCFLFAVAGPGRIHAAVIDNFPEETFLSSLGEPFSPYFAQTFTALPGVANDLAVLLAGYSGPDDVDFHLLITEVTGSGLDFHPTTVLFESPGITFSSSAPATVIHIPLPNLSLVPGNTYAFIFDAFVTRDGLDGTARVATNGTYADGAFYFNQGFGGDTRDEHFADQWFFAEAIYTPPYHDLAFQMNFIPAPAAAWLFGSGLLVMMSFYRRQKE